MKKPVPPSLPKKEIERDVTDEFLAAHPIAENEGYIDIENFYDLNHMFESFKEFGNLEDMKLERIAYRDYSLGDPHYFTFKLLISESLSDEEIAGKMAIYEEKMIQYKKDLHKYSEAIKREENKQILADIRNYEARIKNLEAKLKIKKGEHGKI